MKAILWIPATGAQPMAQVMDRPLIQHVVEQLVERGVEHISLLLNERDTAVRELLGDGRRWGVEIEQRMLWSAPAQADFAAVCAARDGEMMLLGNAARVAHLPNVAGETSSWNTLYFDEEYGIGGWSGWALLHGDALPAFAAHAATGMDWRKSMQESALAAKKVFLEFPSLSGMTPQDVLTANRIAMEGRFPGLFFHGRELRPDVRVARGARIPASAVLQGPCYVGEDAWIGEECRLGPHTVVGPGCVVEQKTCVARSVVAAGTFLGPELDVQDSYVHFNRIQNVRLDTDIEVEEAHVLSALEPQMGSGLLPTAREFLRSLVARASG